MDFFVTMLYLAKIIKDIFSANSKLLIITFIFSYICLLYQNIGPIKDGLIGQERSFLLIFLFTWQNLQQDIVKRWNHQL